MPIQFRIRITRGEPDTRSAVGALLTAIFANEQQIAVRDFLLRTATPAPIPQPPIGTPPTFPQPVPRPTTVPFPTGPAANDPIFSIGKALLRRGLAALGFSVTILDILEQVQLGKLATEIAVAEELLRQAKQKRADAQEPREVEVREPLTDPVPDVVPGAPPRPQIPPDPRLPIPENLPLPTPRLPRIPAPVPSFPLPSPIPSPLPRTIPSTIPLPGIRVLPLFLPTPGVPGLRPLQDPQLRPLGDPVPLTPIVPGVPTLPLGATFLQPGTQPQPQARSQRRCQEVKRRRRRKGKCREGFFRESPGKTTFVTWRERSCGPPTLRSIT